MTSSKRMANKPIWNMFQIVFPIGGDFHALW